MKVRLQSLRKTRFVTLALLGSVTMSAATLPAFADPATSSVAQGTHTVIGPNAMLSDGATAMLSGQWERGIQLTQLGLGSTVAQEDRAAAFANLCAGYVALKKFQRALENCDQSLAISDGNWRAWQNRAAANIGLGKIEESLRDVQRGLQLNPDSKDLQKTLAIARGHEKLQQERMQHLLES